MLDVSRDQCQIMCQGGGGDLLVDRVFRVRNSQVPPHLSFFVRKIKNMFFEVSQYSFEPSFQPSCLLHIAAMANQLNAPPYLTYGNYAHVQRVAIGLGLLEETNDATIGMASFAGLAEDVGINQVHGGCCCLAPA